MRRGEVGVVVCRLCAPCRSLCASAAHARPDLPLEAMGASRRVKRSRKNHRVTGGADRGETREETLCVCELTRFGYSDSTPRLSHANQAPRDMPAPTHRTADRSTFHLQQALPGGTGARLRIDTHRNIAQHPLGRIIIGRPLQRLHMGPPGAAGVTRVQLDRGTALERMTPARAFRTAAS